MSKAYKLSIASALGRLPLPATAKWPGGVWDVEMMRRGKMSVSAFAPRGVDHQSPHSQDELYFVVTGTAQLCIADGLPLTCAPGDVLFVPAGMPHHFEQISDEFVTWVVFYDGLP